MSKIIDKDKLKNIWQRQIVCVMLPTQLQRFLFTSSLTQKGLTNLFSKNVGAYYLEFDIDRAKFRFLHESEFW